MRALLVSSLMIVTLAGTAAAQTVEVQVSVENLAPTNSITFAPLRVGFGNGTYDSFDEGSPASPAIISIAEGGSGADWFPAFQAAEPDATLGTVVSNPAGPLLPGQTASATFTVDTDTNPYFTFGAMVVPSNDYFIGNDSATQYQLFDAAGNLNFTEITQSAADIWDAGSEVDGEFGAAFLANSANADRIADDANVEFDFADLSIFNGLETAAGYTFDSQLQATTDVYRISFSIIPEPATLGLLGLAGLTLLRRR